MATVGSDVNCTMKNLPHCTTVFQHILHGNIYVVTRNVTVPVYRFISKDELLLPITNYYSRAE